MVVCLFVCARERVTELVCGFVVYLRRAAAHVLLLNQFCASDCARECQIAHFNVRHSVHSCIDLVAQLNYCLRMTRDWSDFCLIN